MRIQAVFIDFGGVIMRTEDKGPRTRQAERLGMTFRDLEKIFFESDSSQRASTGEIPEEAHWQAVAEALGVSRQESDKITAEFFYYPARFPAQFAPGAQGQPYQQCLVRPEGIHHPAKIRGCFR
jgi:hypothetical protein